MSSKPLGFSRLAGAREYAKKPPESGGFSSKDGELEGPCG
jgi:hypothetical protein